MPETFGGNPTPVNRRADGLAASTAPCLALGERLGCGRMYSDTAIRCITTADLRQLRWTARTAAMSGRRLGVGQPGNRMNSRFWLAYMGRRQAPPNIGLCSDQRLPSILYVDSLQYYKGGLKRLRKLR